MKRKLLLFSSSRSGNSGFLDSLVDTINRFLMQHAKSLSHGENSDNKPLRLLFIPFAAVVLEWDQYFKMVKSVLAEMAIKVELLALDPSGDVEAQVEQADVFIVGGGNTFCLLDQLYQLNLIPLIRNRVVQGTPYIGWSAGSNIAGPSIATTNDMPIVYPPSFDALNLIPWQINPHYTEQQIKGHNGESRQQRIHEYLTLNPDVKVIALPEGGWLDLCNNKLTYYGRQAGCIFHVLADASCHRISLKNQANLSPIFAGL